MAWYMKEEQGTCFEKFAVLFRNPKNAFKKK